MTEHIERRQPATVRADPIDGGVRFGVAGARVVDVTGLTRREAEEITGLGVLTRGQWATARTTRPASRRWEQVVDALGVAADEVLGADGTAGQVVAVSADPAVVEGLRTALPPSVELVSDPLVVAALAHTPSNAPDLVVLGAARAIAPHRYLPWRRLGVPHLPLVIGPHRIQLGPLVTSAGACLRCVDLHRVDRDAAWPGVLAGVSTDDFERIDGSESPELLAAAVGLLALIVQGALAGAEPPPGLSLSVSDRGPWTLYHHWQPHPACGCHEGGRSLAG